MAWQTILLEKNNGVGLITLNPPEFMVHFIADIQTPAIDIIRR